MSQMNTLKEKIVACARKYEADIISFGSVRRFTDTEVPKIFPGTKTVVCLAFRVLRGVYRGIEEGTTFYQYSTNGVEVMEEVIMPRALLKVCGALEDAGYMAFPQRRHQCVMPQKTGHNHEMHHEEIYHGLWTELQMDWVESAVRCGVGEKSLYGTLLTDEFGPMQRFCFVLTDAEIEESPLKAPRLCDRCLECVRACPGHAISEAGERDEWQCGAYYRGAAMSRNPFMPPDAFSDISDRDDIMEGKARLTQDRAISVMDQCIFYPPIKQGYASSICGNACDVACYKHLEEKGTLSREFAGPFRKRPEWRLTAEIPE